MKMNKIQNLLLSVCKEIKQRSAANLSAVLENNSKTKDREYKVCEPMTENNRQACN